MNSHKSPSSRSSASAHTGLTAPTEPAPAGSPSEAPRSGAKEGRPLTATARLEPAPAGSPSEAPRSGAKEGHRPLTTPTRTGKIEPAPAGSPSEAPRSGAKEGPAFTCTRVGKIARLPSSIRDHLNSRLHDGESAASLLPWLNHLPEAQAILAAQFAARPVTRQNLSEWRRGGFADWLAFQESRAWLTHLREESAAFSQAAGNDTPVSALLAAPLAVALGRCFQQLATTASTKPAHLQRLLDLAAAVNRLRRSDHAESRLRLEHLRSQSAVALADHRLTVEREHWKTAQAQAEIAAREKIESDKIKVEEDKIHRVRVAQRRARFYGADNPYAAMDAPYLAAASPHDHNAPAHPSSPTVGASLATAHPSPATVGPALLDSRATAHPSSSNVGPALAPGHSPSPQTETSSAPPETRNPKLKTPPSLADQEAALERINALLARCAASSPIVGASLAPGHAPSPQLETRNPQPETSSSPPPHPVAPNPTESNPTNPPTTTLTAPAVPQMADLPVPASSAPSCLSG